MRIRGCSLIARCAAIAILAAVVALAQPPIVLNTAVQSFTPVSGTPSIADIWAYTDSLGREFALVCRRNDGLSIYEITNPAAPVFAASIASTGSDMKDVKVSATHAFCVQQNGGIRVVDITDPYSAAVVFDIPDDAHNCFVYGDGPTPLLLTGRNGENPADMRIYNIANPAAPFLVGQYQPTNENTHDVYAQDGLAYVSVIGGPVGTDIVDITNPANPTFVAKVPTGGSSHQSWMYNAPGGQKVLCATNETTGGHLKVFDVTNPANTPLLSEVITPTGASITAHNALVVDRYCFISWYADYLRIYDMGNPSQPVEVGIYDPLPNNLGAGLFDGCWGLAYVKTLPTGAYRLVVTERNLPSGFWVIDFTPPPAMQLDIQVNPGVSTALSVSGLDAGGELYNAISLDTSSSFGAGPLGGLQGDALATLIFPLGTQPFHVLADGSGNYGFAVPLGVAAGLTVDILSIGPVSGSFISSELARVTLRSASRRGTSKRTSMTLKYAITLAVTMFVLCAATPVGAQPPIVLNTAVRSFTPVSGTPWVADVWGYTDSLNRDFALVCRGNEGLSIYEITNPVTPVFAASIPATGSDMKDVKVTATHAFCVQQNGGIRVVDITDPYSASVVFDMPDDAHNCFVYEDGPVPLLLTGRNGENPPSMRLYNIANPNAPFMVGEYRPTNENIHDVYAQDGLAYVSVIGGPVGTDIVDITDPANPTFIAKVPSGGSSHQSWLYNAPGGQKILCECNETAGGHMLVFDVTNPASTPLLSEVTTATSAPISIHNALVVDRYCIVSWYADYLRIFDMANPSQPVEVGTYDPLPNNAGAGTFDGAWGAAYVKTLANGDYRLLLTESFTLPYGFWVIDFTPPPALDLDIVVNPGVSTTLAVSGADPGSEMYNAFSLNTANPFGAGPLAGLQGDALSTLLFPLGVQPFHVSADASGNYGFVVPFGVGAGLTADILSIGLVGGSFIASEIARYTF